MHSLQKCQKSWKILWRHRGIPQIEPSRTFLGTFLVHSFVNPSILWAHCVGNGFLSRVCSSICPKFNTVFELKAWPGGTEASQTRDNTTGIQSYFTIQFSYQQIWTIKYGTCITRQCICICLQTMLNLELITPPFSILCEIYWTATSKWASLKIRWGICTQYTLILHLPWTNWYSPLLDR